MFGLRRTRGAPSAELSRPALTPRWLRDAIFAHRLAFEREMERDRDHLERRFQAYLDRENARQD